MFTERAENDRKMIGTGRDEGCNISKICNIFENIFCSIFPMENVEIPAVYGVPI